MSTCGWCHHALNSCQLNIPRLSSNKVFQILMAWLSSIVSCRQQTAIVWLMTTTLTSKRKRPEASYVGDLLLLAQTPVLFSSTGKWQMYVTHFGFCASSSYSNQMLATFVFTIQMSVMSFLPPNYLQESKQVYFPRCNPLKLRRRNQREDLEKRIHQPYFFCNDTSLILTTWNYITLKSLCQKVK